MNRHTSMTVERRSHKWGVKVCVNHGNPMKYGMPRQRTSPARMRAQALWVRTRLYENGDDSIRELYTYSAETRAGTTVVCWAGDNMRLAT